MSDEVDLGEVHVPHRGQTLCLQLVRTGYRGNGRLALLLESESNVIDDRELWCFLSVNVPEVVLAEDEFVLDPLADRFPGVIDALVDGGWIADTLRRVDYGMVRGQPVYRLLVRENASEPSDDDFERDLVEATAGHECGINTCDIEQARRLQLYAYAAQFLADATGDERCKELLRRVPASRIEAEGRQLADSPSIHCTRCGAYVYTDKESAVCGSCHAEVRRDPEEGREQAAPNVDLDPRIERDVILDGITVEHLRQLEGEDVLLGVVGIFGVNSHAMFIRVEESEEMGQHPTCDPHDRWQAFVEAEPEGAFQTIEVPGFEGQYVFMLTPFIL